MALTETIYEKVKSSFFPAAILRRRGRAVIFFYVIKVFVGLGRALSFLCPIPSYQKRRTSYQPAKGCETRPGTKNYICARKLLAVGRSTLRAQCSGGWFRFDKGRMPGRRSSTVGSRRVRFGSRARTRNRRCTILAATYVDLDLRNSSN